MADPPSWPDAKLVAGARSGDRSCFDVLVRRHQGKVTAIARALCADAAECQDLAQEAFIRAWTNLDLLGDAARFGPWLGRIAFACTIDGLRRHRPTEVLLADLPSRDVPAESALATHELTAAVRSAIARLPARYRRPLVLYHLDGLRQDRIAAALGVAPGTVRSLVTRARDSLRVELGRLTEENDMAIDLLREPSERALLHVCNGHATWSLLEQAGVPGYFTVSADLLIEGPCPPLWERAWWDVRGRFLGERFGSPPAEEVEVVESVEGPSWRPRSGARPDIEQWDLDFTRALAAADEVDEIVLWYEHDLFCQLLLIRLLALVSRHGPRRPPLSLVCIGEHEDVPAFKGLGELGPDQLASLFETRAPIDEAMVSLGRDAWTAYTAADPEALQALLDRDLSALPFLARALRRHLEEYPAVGDGLSRSERQLLTLVRDGVRTPLRAWQGLHAAEDCHYLPDESYLDLVERLSAAPSPLLVVEGDLRPLSHASATLSLTPLAEEVLRGRDWLSARGSIDRWLGGVHLTDPATARRWDPATRRLACYDPPR